MMSFGGGGYGYSSGGFNPMQPLGSRPPWEDDPYAPRLPFPNAGPPVPDPRMAGRAGPSIGSTLTDVARGGISGNVGQIGARGGGGRGLTDSVGDALSDYVKKPVGWAAGQLGDLVGWDKMKPEHKAGTLLGLVDVGTSVYGSMQDRKAAKEQEDYRRRLEEEERDRMTRSGRAIAPMLQEYLARGNR